MATWPWPVALRASESPAPDHTGRAGRAFCSRTRGQQGMTAARRSPRMWAASPAQLLARQPPPAICVCFGCTRCAQRWQNHSPPRGGEGREETSRTFPASAMWSRAVRAAPLQGCSSEVARWGAGLGVSPEEEACRVF